MLLPPEGTALYEADAAGQESRLMAIRCGDQTMLKVFTDNMNFHSMTGSAIIGRDYYEFEDERKAEDGAGYLTEQRQLGKLTNLSCNYRIGGKALSEKAFVNYDTFMTVETGNFLVNTFKRTYPGVPSYWDDVVWDSKKSGYTEVFGGRRYKLSKWSSDRWMTESSAINVPIQGAGASMKEIAICEMMQKNADCLFALDLHDANFMYVKEDEVKQKSEELDHTLNNIDYSKYWGFTPPIPLPYESNYGSNFSDVK
jgi:DNA polymerase I-like protein with 3'-5' exonuclease and polymerase domains